MVDWILVGIVVFFGIVGVVAIAYFSYLIFYPKWKIWRLIEKEIEKRRCKRYG